MSPGFKEQVRKHIEEYGIAFILVSDFCQCPECLITKAGKRAPCEIAKAYMYTIGLTALGMPEFCFFLGSSGPDDPVGSQEVVQKRSDIAESIINAIVENNKGIEIFPNISLASNSDTSVVWTVIGDDLELKGDLSDIKEGFHFIISSYYGNEYNSYEVKCFIPSLRKDTPFVPGFTPNSSKLLH